jgi:beta-barrel assembly-enhancing protease
MRKTFVWMMAGAILAAAPARKELKPGFNLFSPDQDIQMGKEASDEVYKTRAVIHNEELEAYLTRIGQRLQQSPRAGKFPFHFAVINDASINAFALPGGPMFVHTALIQAADNESQIAGVLAHEMSHVALRHGTHEVSKQNLIQLPAMLAGSIAPGGMMGSLAKMGINLASGSVLLSFSRAAESEADLNGTRMMNDAGYDPHEMARFFEKLQAQAGKGGDTRLANFLSDHPTPGNRVKAVDDEIPFLPKMNYHESEPGALDRAKAIVASLPPPPKQPTAAGQPASQVPSALRPSARLTTYQGRTFSVGYPDNWTALPDPNSATVTFAAQGGVTADAAGQGRVGYGIVTNTYVPQDGPINLQRDTVTVLNAILQGGPNLRKINGPQNGVAGGQPALVTQLEGPAAFGNETELDMLVTVARQDGLLYFIFVAPKSEWNGALPTFNAILQSLR